MQLSAIPQTVFRPEPPPLWYVTNGDLTVGPVVTDRLMRGVEYGRVPHYCQVRMARGAWRALDAVREIAARNRPLNLEAAGQELAEWVVPIERMRDEMEFCHTASWLSLLATGATCAMLHYRGRAARSLITRAIIGPLSNDRLGYALPENDPVLRAARLGRPAMGPGPRHGWIEKAVAKHFAGSPAEAVAMIPAFVGGRLSAILELARPGHAFRRTDLQRAERIVQRMLNQRAH